MADTPEEIQKAQKLYLFVGLVLFAGTVATYLVATVPWLDVGQHGFDKWDMILGLLIACTKSSMVALIFMHLNHERKGVYWLFASGLVFGAAMAFLIFLAKSDPIHWDNFRTGEAATPSAVVPSIDG